MLKNRKVSGIGVGNGFTIANPPQAEFHINTNQLVFPSAFIPVDVFRTTSNATGLGNFNAWRIFAGTGTGTEKFAVIHNPSSFSGNDVIIKNQTTDGELILNTNAPLGQGIIRIGEVNNPSPSPFPHYGRFLYFSGGSENTDAFWIARYNAAFDISQLRINISDRPVPNGDMLNIGKRVGLVPGNWLSFMVVRDNARAGINQQNPVNNLEIRSGQFFFGSFTSVGAGTLNPITSAGPTRSGLRFSNLNATMPVDAPTNPSGKVLSVNQTGDVILVPGVTAANNGCSLSNPQTVVLGNNVGATLGQLISNREIPMNGNYLISTQTAPDNFASGKVGFGIAPGNTGANALRSSDITMQVNGSISLFDGTGNSSLFFGEDQVPSGILGKWGIHYDVGPDGGLNFWRPSGSGGFGNRFLFLSDNGNVGIGSFFPPTPGNALEITSYPGQQPAGLRFSNLTAAGPLGTPNGNVLTVDASGDVILVPGGTGGGIGTCTPFAPTIFPANANGAVDLTNNNNFYFLGAGANNTVNSVIVGRSCASAPQGKLDVLQNTNANIGSKGIYVENGDITNGNIASVIGVKSFLPPTGPVCFQALKVAGWFEANDAPTQICPDPIVVTSPQFAIYVPQNGGVTQLGWPYQQRLPGNLLEVNGTISTPTWSSSSDSILKENISPLTHGLDVIRASNPILYSYNGKGGFNTKGRYVGLIAEKLIEVAPYAVDTSFVKLYTDDVEYTPILNIDQGAVMYTSLNAIKQLDSAVTQLQNNPPSGVWSQTGNAGTVDGTNFIGTTDNVPFNIRVNNQKAGRIAQSVITGSGNTFWGYQAGNSNIENFISFTGLNNSAFGYKSLFLNVSGNSNAALGSYSGYNITSGNNNTSIGVGALSYNTIGSENTAIGYKADVSVNNLTNATAIGANAVVNASNKIRLGNTSVTVIEGTPAAYTSSSDIRFKNNIQENVKGLEFIKKLRPITYNLDARKFDGFLLKNMPDSIKNAYMDGVDYALSESIIHTGFIGQEVEQAANACGYAFDGIHIPADTGNSNYSLSYSQFVVPLVKAIQEQQAQIDAMSSLLSECCSTHVKTTNTVPSTDVELASPNAILYQNFPNPFGDGTVIRYFVPANAGSAVMMFYDEFGKEIKNAELPHKGQTSELNISTFNLANGIYSYSLVVNGRVIDTMKMLKTK